MKDLSAVVINSYVQQLRLIEVLRFPKLKAMLPKTSQLRRCVELNFKVVIWKSGASASTSLSLL